jgi:hypothetical protein
MLGSSAEFGISTPMRRRPSRDCEKPVPDRSAHTIAGNPTRARRRIIQ